MTFYEELSVPPDASLDTIREAYRNVARLLHPDAQTNPVLKESADVQMKRINHLYETLADPERRRRYDQELARPPERDEPIILQPSVRFGRSHSGIVVWLAATAICATFIIWLATRETSAPTVYPRSWGVESADAGGAPSALSRAATAILPTSGSSRQRDDEVARLRGELAAVYADRDRLSRQIAAMEAERKFQPPPSEPRRQVAVIPPASIQTAAASLPQISLPDVSLNPLRLPASPQARWAGSWAYNYSGSDGKTTALFPPEFIEAVIREDGGRLRGQYHARFKVGDSKISPDVDFQFDGMVAGKVGRFSWVGPDGAKGDVQLRLISDAALEVVWSASDLGKSMGLASGTAVLVRKN